MLRDGPPAYNRSCHHKWRRKIPARVPASHGRHPWLSSTCPNSPKNTILRACTFNGYQTAKTTQNTDTAASLDLFSNAEMPARRVVHRNAPNPRTSRPVTADATLKAAGPGPDEGRRTAPLVLSSLVPSPHKPMSRSQSAAHATRRGVQGRGGGSNYALFMAVVDVIDAAWQTFADRHDHEGGADFLPAIASRYSHEQDHFTNLCFHANL